MLFEQFRKERARVRLLAFPGLSGIIRHAIYGIDAKYRKGSGPGKEAKRQEALDVIMTELELLGHKVYRDDSDLIMALNGRIDSLHNIETAKKDTRYNEHIDPDVVRKAHTITYT